MHQAHYEKFVTPAINVLSDCDKPVKPALLRQAMVDGKFVDIDEFDKEIMSKRMPRWHKGVNDALRSLRRDGLAKLTGSGWSLTPAGVDRARKKPRPAKTAREALTDILTGNPPMSLADIYAAFEAAGMAKGKAWKASVRKNLQNEKSFKRVENGVFTVA